jgi:hypothetical protein
MPIVALLQKAAFDPETTHILTTAFDKGLARRLPNPKLAPDWHRELGRYRPDTSSEFGRDYYRR